MKCWFAQTLSIAAWISAASGRYCGVRSSSGTCMAGLVCVWTAMKQLSSREVDKAPILSALVSVVFAEPVDEFPDPNFDGRSRPVAHFLDQSVDVGVGLGDVAELQRQE